MEPGLDFPQIKFLAMAFFICKADFGKGVLFSVRNVLGWKEGIDIMACFSWALALMAGWE